MKPKSENPAALGLDPQQRFKSSALRIRLFQNSISQSPRGDFCNTICQVLTSGRWSSRKVATVNFPGAAGNGLRACRCEPRDAARSEVLQAEGRADEIPIFARGLEGFAPLAERSRYAIAESHTAVVSEQVLLCPRLPCHPRNEKASVRLATFSCSGRGNFRPLRAAASTASRPLREYPPRC